MIWLCCCLVGLDVVGIVAGVDDVVVVIDVAVAADVVVAVDLCGCYDAVANGVCDVVDCAVVVGAVVSIVCACVGVVV